MMITRWFVWIFLCLHWLLSQARHHYLAAPYLFQKFTFLIDTRPLLLLLMRLYFFGQNESSLVFLLVRAVVILEVVVNIGCNFIVSFIIVICHHHQVVLSARKMLCFDQSFGLCQKEHFVLSFMLWRSHHPQAFFTHQLIILQLYRRFSRLEWFLILFRNWHEGHRVKDCRFGGNWFKTRLIYDRSVKQDVWLDQLFRQTHQKATIGVVRDRHIYSFIVKFLDNREDLTVFLLHPWLVFGFPWW